MKKMLLILVSTLLLGVCAAHAAEPTALDDLAGVFMTGSFSSAAQAAADPEYRDIRLHMAPIWLDRTDGRWLYVEQAAAGSLDKPYRQRVYHVTGPTDGAFRSEVFTMAAPLRFAGAWAKPELLGTLTPDSLALRDGCVVILKQDEAGSFTGSTVGHDCASDLRGAVYATSTVTITLECLTSWDQGFAADGTQVWGATKGPYVFDRLAASADSVAAGR
jgi:hypothetical protein